jgi:divalent metal cation (Fe/Co/Zn/Cd) transporter
MPALAVSAARAALLAALAITIVAGLAGVAVTSSAWLAPTAHSDTDPARKIVSGVTGRELPADAQPQVPVTGSAPVR